MLKVAAASLCALVLCAVAAPVASAQIFYQPVQYQYFSGGRMYYYGGSDPQVHYDANYLSNVNGYGRTQGYAFHSGNIDTHREVVTEQTRVYTDMIPTWNARIFGFTADDAHNEANNNAATYFPGTSGRAGAHDSNAQEDCRAHGGVAPHQRPCSYRVQGGHDAHRQAA